MTLRLASTTNFRDLGGAQAGEGRTVRQGLVFRSEAILEPTEEDVLQLKDVGIVLVCDLRGDSERQRAPNRWWAAQGVELLALDILADIRGSQEAWDTLRERPDLQGAKSVMHMIYRALPAAGGPHLATIFSRMVRGDVPILIHCTAGKDRTGFISAMILSALGVSREVILADYLASGSRINEQVVRATEQLIVERAGDLISTEAMAAITGVDQDYLQESYDTIESEFGSVENYLETVARLDAPMKAALRAQLLD